jgi:hypothetical protein
MSPAPRDPSYPYRNPRIVTGEELETLDSRRDAETPLVAAEDWQGLVRHRRQTLSLLPDSPDALLDLAEALVAAAAVEEALELLVEYHHQEPECPDGQDLILDALFALGRTEHDFPWVERPPVWRLESGALDRCLELLEEGDGPVSAGDLYYDLLEQGYPTFSVDELAAALRGDPRFSVPAGEGPHPDPWDEVIGLAEGQRVESGAS